MCIRDRYQRRVHGVVRELETQRADVQEKMLKRNQKLEKLQACVEKLQSEHDNLLLKEENIREILGRVALEAEEDIECAKSRREALKLKVQRLSTSLKVASESYPHFDLVYRYWQETQLQPSG
eukprot:TRINITY_DN6009_c0_g1_i1.p1 TRINITY_DN6009_c0_g1~~TRINITY_DN6009_c0_g1_i1.p1  ORF type:complete len:123 (-),score=31.03 TRINITY_DN6009_c0_g1_i1:136-504(-)